MLSNAAIKADIKNNSVQFCSPHLKLLCMPLCGSKTTNIVYTEFCILLILANFLCASSSVDSI